MCIKWPSENSSTMKDSLYLPEVMEVNILNIIHNMKNKKKVDHTATSHMIEPMFATDNYHPALPKIL